MIFLALFASTAAAMGERQILPRQTIATLIFSTEEA
jgi:hypothetical protein